MIQTRAVLFSELEDYEEALAALDAKVAPRKWADDVPLQVDPSHADGGKYVLRVKTNGPHQYTDIAATHGTVVAWDRDWFPPVVYEAESEELPPEEESDEPDGTYSDAEEETE